jgi:biopolymer transport protein ExbB
MTIARAMAASGLMLGIILMATAAMAQPATQPAQPQPGAPAAAPATDPAAEPAPGEPPPPAIGPDGLPIAPAAEATPAAPAPAPVEEEKKVKEITLVSMVLGASLVVKIVMAMLVLWSVATWTILISKLLFFSGLNGSSDRFLQAFRNAGSLPDAAKGPGRSFRNNALAKMLLAAADEIGTGKKNNLSSRVAQRMGIVQAEVGETLSSGMGVFATVGSIAAIVGLFGTV